MTESDGFDRLMKRWNEFENVYRQRNNKEMFFFFDTVIYSMLLDYVNFTGIKLSVERSEEGITVTLSDLKSLLILCDEDRRLLQILSVANCVFVRKNKQEGVELEIWFRGREWEEKPDDGDIL